jgi:predicted enzyme related to lactoylglutathione lyase
MSKPANERYLSWLLFFNILTKTQTCFVSWLKLTAMQRVTGLGGFFIKAKDPKALCAWYEKHLGVPFAGQTYTSFKWVNENNPNVPGSTNFCFFPETTKYFEPSTNNCMVNFRVKDLEALLKVLKEEGVTVDEKVESVEYGKFGWIIDPEGNKVELWEPVDD